MAHQRCPWVFVLCFQASVPSWHGSCGSSHPDTGYYTIKRSHFPTYPSAIKQSVVNKQSSKDTPTMHPEHSGNGPWPQRHSTNPPQCKASFPSFQARAPVSAALTSWVLLRSCSYSYSSLNKSYLRSSPTLPDSSVSSPLQSPGAPGHSSKSRRCLYLSQEGAVDTRRPQGCPRALKGNLGQSPCAHARLLSFLASGHSGVEELSGHLQERAGAIRGERARGCCRGRRGGAGNSPGGGHRAPTLAWAT